MDEIAPRTDPVMFEVFGKIVVEWANIEALLGEILSWFLSANPGKMYIVTQSISVSVQMGWIRELAEDQLQGRDLEDFLEVMGVADTLREERNFLAHGIWKPSQVGSEIVEVETVNLKRARGVIAGRIVTLADLRNLQAEAGSVRSILFRFWQSTAGAP